MDRHSPAMYFGTVKDYELLLELCPFFLKRCIFCNKWRSSVFSSGSEKGLCVALNTWTELSQRFSPLFLLPLSPSLFLPLLSFYPFFLYPSIVFCLCPLPFLCSSLIHKMSMFFWKIQHDFGRTTVLLNFKVVF